MKTALVLSALIALAIIIVLSILALILLRWREKETQDLIKRMEGRYGKED